MIVLFRFKNVQADVDKNGKLTVYEPESGKILCTADSCEVYYYDNHNNNWINKYLYNCISFIILATGLDH